jgi:hypothetical protein
MRTSTAQKRAKRRCVTDATIEFCWGRSKLPIFDGEMHLPAHRLPSATMPEQLPIYLH